MKKILYLMICSLIVLNISCSDNEDNTYQTYPVTVQIIPTIEYSEYSVEGLQVKLSSTTTSSSFEAKADADGKVVFNVPVGIYEVSVSDRKLINSKFINFNGRKSGIAISANWTGSEIAELELTASTSAQVIIKELYVGGCQKDDGSGVFIYDRYITLYNNSDETANLGEMALAMAMPYNSSGGNNRYYVNGVLSYESEGWVPAGQAIWYFQQNVSIAPGKQIVIALTNAVDNTKTYSQSINFDNPEYYCTYDNSVFTHALTYVSPAASIPTSHYLKATAYGAGTAWAISMVSPAVFLFTPEGRTASDFANDASLNDLYGGSSALASKKVPIEWVNDGIEVYTTSYNNNQKRLTPTIDAGYVYYTNKLGYSLYRNVDAEATEAIEGNKDKLIYGYSHGTTVAETTSTDPSGIDAEASIKNGARVVYKDTNNSTNDFHQRNQASLRD